VAEIVGSYWFLTILAILSISMSMGGLWLVRKTVSHETLMDHHDVAAAMLSVVGALYAVVLGLVVVGSITKFEQARETVAHEANSLRNIYSLTRGLDETLKLEIRKLCVEYAREVIEDEWPKMAQSSRSELVDTTLAKLSARIIEFAPSTEGQANLQQYLLSAVNEIDDDRALRTILSTPSFGELIWAVLIVGGIVLIVYTYFFGVENLKLQLLMTGLVTVVLVLNMIIVAMFAYPFSGDVKVLPKPFQRDLDIFQHWHHIHFQNENNKNGEANEHS
jgi:hypothetical protein